MSPWSKNIKKKCISLHAVEKYEMMDGANTQNDYETTSKKLTDKKKTDLFCVLCKCV